MMMMMQERIDLNGTGAGDEFPPPQQQGQQQQQQQQPPPSSTTNDHLQQHQIHHHPDLQELHQMHINQHLPHHPHNFMNLNGEVPAAGSMSPPPPPSQDTPSAHPPWLDDEQSAAAAAAAAAAVRRRCVEVETFLPPSSIEPQHSPPSVVSSSNTTPASSSTNPAHNGGGPNSKKSSSRRNAWGNLSYADLITQAIESAPEKRLTLAQVYEWMVQNITYFKDKGDSNSSAGWKNSIRHNLSLHSRFMRVQNEGTGKSSWWMINKEAKTTGGKSSRRRPSNASSSSSAVDGTEARTATATGGPGKKPRGRSKKQPKVNGINRGASGGGPGGGGPNLNPHLDHVLSSMHPPGVVGGPPINLQSNQAAAMMEMFPGGPPQTQFPFNDLRLSPNGGMVPPPPHAVQSFGSGGPYPQEWSPEGYPPPPPHPPNAAQCGFFPGRNYLDGIPPSSADAADFNPRALSPLSRTGGGSASSPSSFGFNRFDSAASTASPGGASEFHPQFPSQEKNGIPPPSSSPILIHGPHTPYGMQTSTSNNRDTSPRPPPQQQQQSVNGRGSHAQFTSQEEPTSLLSPHHHQQQQHNNFFQGSENPSPGPASSRTSNPSGNNNNNNNNNASGTGAGPTSPLARASSTGSSSVGSMLERALVPKQESQPESPNMHQQSSPSQFPWPQGQPHHHNNPQQQQQQQQQQHNHPSQGNNFSEMDEFLKPEQLDSYMPHHSHQLEQHHHHQHPQHHHHHHHQQGHLHHSQSDRIAAAAAAAGSVQPPQSSPGQQYQQHLTQPPWVR